MSRAQTAKGVDLNITYHDRAADLYGSGAATVNTVVGTYTVPVGRRAALRFAFVDINGTSGSSIRISVNRSGLGSRLIWMVALGSTEVMSALRFDVLLQAGDIVSVSAVPVTSMSYTVTVLIDEIDL